VPENIDLLLEKLPQGSLAHELVSRLKEFRRDEWLAVLETFLKSRLEQKVKELTHGKGKASRD